MANKKFSRQIFLIFVAVFVILSISLPSVHADVGVAAAAVDDEDGETLDMDAPVVEEKVEVDEKVEEEEETVVVADEEPEVVEKEAEPEPAVTDDAVEEDTPVAAVEEDEPVPVEAEEEEKLAEIIQSEDVSPNKISIPFVDKLTKQDVKKIAAFGLGAWGAVTGVGWAMQQFGGEQKYD